MTLLEKFQRMYKSQYDMQKEIFEKIIDKLEYAIDDNNSNDIYELEDSKSCGLLVTKFQINLNKLQRFQMKESVVRDLFNKYLENANIEVESLEFSITESCNMNNKEYYLNITLTTVQSLQDTKEEDN